MISGLPVAEDQNEILSFQEYHWQNEFGPKFSAVQLAITDIDLLTEDGNFGINHYLKLKEKINEIILGVLVFFCIWIFCFKGYVSYLFNFSKNKGSWKWWNIPSLLPLPQVFEILYFHI